MAPFFAVFPALLSAIPAGLHVTVLLLSASLITFALLAAAFSVVNAFGSPYETLHGTTGLYLWNFIAGCCGLLVMILFAAEVKVQRLSERIANHREEQFVFLTRAEAFSFSFWLLSVCASLHCASACLLTLSGARLPFPKAAGTGAGVGGVELMY
ncbi:clarin-1 [Callorhinchus milii]|uniref:clarin-1 n=1 Tax=Callorhinchus milii TaxID=7868 RepID=UPI00045725D0|nr:clarin-1 [Callorhinchus milii]|eukprot:gi/632968685/ref/XP_007900660.1/ PREDICTED: clarin-1 [Callorhinchus milii]